MKKLIITVRMLKTGNQECSYPGTYCMTQTDGVLEIYSKSPSANNFREDLVAVFPIETWVMAEYRGEDKAANIKPVK